MIRRRRISTLQAEQGMSCVFFFSSRRRHTRLQGDWSSDVCSSDLGRDGLAVNSTQLHNGVVFDIEQQRYEGVLRPVVRRTRPKVTTSQLARKYPRVVIIDRNSFTLTLYKNLKNFRSYGIAVGQAGLETPAGLHEVMIKQVDPAWNVPNEA